MSMEETKGFSDQLDVGEKKIMADSTVSFLPEIHGKLGRGRL